MQYGEFTQFDYDDYGGMSNGWISAIDALNVLVPNQRCYVLGQGSVALECMCSATPQHKARMQVSAAPLGAVA